MRGLDGHLEAAYAALLQVSSQGWLNTEKSWLYSELGEMAVRLGRDDEARRWFQRDLDLVPGDVYVRTAYADLLLRQGDDAEALELLRGMESFEPLLLRIAIAQQRLHDPALPQSSARLRAAFSAELQRGRPSTGVNRRDSCLRSNISRRSRSRRLGKTGKCSVNPRTSGSGRGRTCRRQSRCGGAGPRIRAQNRP